MPTRIIASSFALIGFAVAIVVGLAAGNDALTTMWRALVAMAACYAVGGFVGYVGRRGMDQHLTEYKQQHPIPSVEDESESSDEPAAESAGQSSQDARRQSAGQSPTGSAA